jgi:hypothetical protein
LAIFKFSGKIPISSDKLIMFIIIN